MAMRAAHLEILIDFNGKSLYDPLVFSIFQNSPLFSSPLKYKRVK